MNAGYPNMKTVACAGAGSLKTLLSAAILLALHANASAQTAVTTPDAASATAAADPQQTAAAAGSSSNKTKDDPTQLSDVVVTYRASLEKAMDLKRDSVGVVDAIMAEDIGKFP